MSSARVCTRSFASRFESGSSIRNACGRRTIAARARRAAAARRTAARACARAARRARGLSAASRDELARARPPRTLRLFSGNSMFRAHRHVRIQRVALEHHRDVAVLRLDVVRRRVADPDRALGRILEPRDHPERGRLPAARRPEQHEELVVLDLEVEVAHRDDVAEALRDVVEHDPSHRDVRLRGEGTSPGGPIGAAPRPRPQSGGASSTTPVGDDEIPSARGPGRIDPRLERIVARAAPR